MALAIRGATAADRDHVVRLLGAQLDEHDIALERSALAAAVDGMLAEPSRGRILVAVDGGTAIGVAWLSRTWTLEHGGTAMWLEELYVEPTHRNAGIGSRLLDAAIEAARGQGALAVDLEVEREHARAEHLYDRRGFRRHARTRWVLKL